MSKYIIRLDDASPNSNAHNWDRIESLLSKYSICPLVGVIPNCQDESFSLFEGETNEEFWNIRVKRWVAKGWEIALHGYEHIFKTSCGGINPVNSKSEFAGIDLTEQRRIIKEGIKIFEQNNIHPKVFFAPAHTFDDNTLMALTIETDIRFISDTPTFTVYEYKGFTFVPQQAGMVRNLPFPLITFCYHPNEMKSEDFIKLERFLAKKKDHFISFPLVKAKHKKLLVDRVCCYLYRIKGRMKKC